ncbi:potassium transporter Kup [Phenylobacterium sp. SCN 70-31]|uniref:potassium transporter Kup n=1 Tax=Phenylobacterium sp. SCN 70-31 TaxID=1660129 RepID=UPI00086F1936|nr:potassium transporter Kup [Phenylobacterium sp. SCN 70-31]ODT85143.1 MAG: potassium transporter Kup [Phenylobacterium sp. SCN 70-31]
MADQAVDAQKASEDTSPSGNGHPRKEGFWALALGSIGVVFGDIGTSPLYAMRVALANTESGGAERATVLGVVSLITWALIVIVTIKYVVFLMRADNKGEGGTLALMALAQRVTEGRRSFVLLALGMLGAALFYADGVLTPAVSVVSAVEGLKLAPGIGPSMAPYVLPISVAILIALFALQSRGTASVGRFFGPITLLWFLTLGWLGAIHISDDPTILHGLLPHHGVLMLIDNGLLGFLILGGVFLAVTGAEALYADMGHFGRGPLRAAWALVVLPCLLLNYFGQGALVLAHPESRVNPFFEMIPEAAFWPVLALATAGTIIASQAVITGAFSVTQQAVQLGLFPRIDIRRTSETQAGQIYVPQVNIMMLVGVLILVALFRTSDHLAAAYGIAVTGAMLVDTLLFFFIIRHMWKRPAWQAVLGAGAFGLVDVVFVGANLLKIPQGAWAPLLISGGLVLVMWTWTRGAQILAEKTRRDSVSLVELADILKARAPHRAPGTAVFLTSDPDTAPVALMHNLKHNKVLHEKNIILTVHTAETPRVREDDRVRIDAVNDDFKTLEIRYGFMESPNIPKALGQCRKLGLKFDIMATSFFLGRRSVVPSAQSGMPLWQDKLFIFLMKNAANPTDFYKIPPGRVVEMGAQVTV